MPAKRSEVKPDMDYININTIQQQIDDCVISFFTKRGIDIYDMSQRKHVNHNMLTLCMMNVYNTLFKPDRTLWNNQKSLIDYDNIELLTVIANKFIELSLEFNKSLGLMQFSLFTGIHRSTLAEWRDNKNVNPARSDLINNICECHKMEQIGLLNDTPVGALAVANNDIETGLQWSQNQLLTAQNNAVFLIPSERLNRLQISDSKPQEIPAAVIQEQQKDQL